MRSTGLTAALIVTVALAAGCATPPGQRAADPSAAPDFLEVQPAWVSCPDAAPDPQSWLGADATELPHIGTSFPATAAIVCSTAVQRRTDGGEDVVAVESRAEDIEALLTALRLPDEPRTDGICTMDLPIVDWFALLDDAGRWVRPGLPTDACGKIRIEVRDAVGSLDLTRVASRVLREQLSAEAAALNCGQQWTDMIWMETSLGSRTMAGRAVPFDRGETVRLCRYLVPASERGSEKPSGEFDGGTVLTPEQWGPVADAISAAPKAAPCQTQAGRFAMIQPTGGTGGTGGEIYVELDGCQRIMTSPYEGDPGLVQADAALIGQLTQPG